MQLICPIPAPGYWNEAQVSIHLNQISQHEILQPDCRRDVFIFSLQAQDKTVMAFPITDYIIEKDSVTIVQVVLPEGIEVREKAVEY